MYKLVLSLVTMVMFLGACTHSGVTEKIIIASEQGDCIGVAPMKCLLIKKEGQQDWEFLYNGIEGFDYEPGYEYIIEIKKETIKNPAADQSSVKYIFVKELSKIQKVSENMPIIAEEEIVLSDSVN